MNQSSIRFEFYWNSDTIKTITKTRKPDYSMAINFGLFASGGIINIEDLISSDENNSLTLGIDNKLHVNSTPQWSSTNW